MGQAGSSSRDIQHYQPLNDRDFYSTEVKAIPYKEIIKATKKFHPNSLLGETSCRNPRVYKGWIDDRNFTATKPGSGIPVAVKKMEFDDKAQKHEEWVEQLNYFSQLHHPNLVKLIGYSFDENGKRVLVHEFMEKGSLDQHLFKDDYPSLPWATRMKVALGAARALAFLHGLEKPLILGFCGLGSADILLDCDYNAKFSDLGRASRKLAYHDVRRARSVTIDNVTTAYAAPEHLLTGHVTPKSDVYSFGLVLLELMSGHRVIDYNQPRQKKYLKDWTAPYLGKKGKVSEIMDSKLGGEYPHEEARKVGIVILQCMSSEPKLRPSISDVVVVLECIMKIP